MTLASPSQVPARASFSAIFKADSASKTASIEIFTYNLNINVLIYLQIKNTPLLRMNTYMLW